MQIEFLERTVHGIHTDSCLEIKKAIALCTAALGMMAQV